MPFDAVGDTGQFFLGILHEVLSGAMRFEAAVVLVLFVNEEPPRFGLVAVHLVHQAAWFLARFFAQLDEEVRNFVFMSRLCYPRYYQHNHCLLRVIIFLPGPWSSVRLTTSSPPRIRP